MKLLFIHGRSQQGKTSDRLLKEWMDPLCRTLETQTLGAIDVKSISVPFYGDVLDRFTRGVAFPISKPDLSNRSSDSFDAFLREYAAELGTAHPDLLKAELRPDTGAGRSRDRQRRGGAENDFLRRGPQNWWWVLEVVRALDRNFTTMSEYTIATFLRDVYLYLSDREIRRQIDDIVIEELDDGPMVVVAHSLGTVVAYNVLSTWNGRITALITLGSPLAIHAVAARLPEEKAVPKCVAEWFNAYDEQDIVALNPLQPMHFTTARPIENHTVDNFTENHHGIAGYLSDGSVARKIVASLGKEPE